MVAGGLEEISYTTRLTPRTSFRIRLEIFRSTSADSATQSAVMPSWLSTTRKRDGVLVTALVTDHADGFDRQQHGKRLPDLLVQTRRRDFLEDDSVGLAQHFQAFLGDLAEHADGQAGAGKGLALDDFIRQS